MSEKEVWKINATVITDREGERKRVLDLYIALISMGQLIDALVEVETI